ncbi:serine phosphatase RsbU (regulator of sigma subunit) [Spinactinospora alkalitolerans]|uniref:protein-serine/threonine phosphatase n=1 Tax=Spinactinospora alkalitolerans TaxID=687207 RepID=A0A852U898_9ACTN|nr:GAF domain-containing SpoIIE family protein phosphatase [Spinactinospora alkalitolerans]NYE50150.1 serine phosphatase RsbU (regulator of sigma subunit) [Spinactinospora alkalitolerans]
MAHDTEGAGNGAVSALEGPLSRLTLMAEVSTALGSSLDGDDVLRRLTRLLVPQLADWCTASLLGDRLRRVALVHRDPGAVPPDTEGVLPPPDPLSESPVERVLAGEGPLLVTEFPEAATPLSRAHKELTDALGAHTEILIPLRARRRILGSLSLVRTDPERPLTEADFALVEDLAHRAALALDNARLYAAQRDTAHDFQRALLPELPDIGRLRLAARYTPAQAGAEVGGDWYDALVLPDGATALTVGDVSGHDLAAAVQMSKLQSMLRTLVWDHREPPSAIMRRLDSLLQYLPSIPQTATVVYGRVEGGAGGPWQWHWANAGHLPPLLVTDEGVTRYLDAGHGVLLGVDDTLARLDARTDLPPCSTLLLYTDGLVERRGEFIERGMVRLRQQAALLARESVDAFCDGLLESMVDTPEDDVVLLALRIPEAAAPAAQGGTG